MAITLSGDGIARANLAADVIDSTKLADDAVNSEHYVDASIDNAHLADDAIGVAELSATGTASSSTYLRGDNSWATAGVADDYFASSGLSAKDLGAGLHIKTGDSGLGSVNSNFGQLVIEGNTTAGISILTSTTHEGVLAFSDSGGHRGLVRYVHSSDKMSFATGDVDRMSIDSTGAVTKPLQPSFSVNMSAVQSNIAASTEVTIQFDTEIFDTNADFNTGTYTFTAPVTGKYLLTLATRLQAVQNDSTYIVVKIKTSNREYSNIEDVTTFVGDADYWTPSVAAVADMDANDTAYAIIYASASGNEIDVGNSAAYTKFSGILLAQAK